MPERVVRLIDPNAEDRNQPSAEESFDDVPEMILDRPGRGCPLEPRLLLQHPAVELTQRRAWLDTKLLHQRPPRVVVALKRLRLAPRSVQGEHELPAQPLPKWVLCDQTLELADELASTP